MLYMVFSQMLKSCKSSPCKNYKADKDFAKIIDFKNKNSSKTRNIHKIKKGIY